MAKSGGEVGLKGEDTTRVKNFRVLTNFFIFGLLGQIVHLLASLH